jgi:hypothetical protein
MKTVHSPDMVCHLWANQSQSHARNSSRNIYFDGDTIYSYGGHFPIANHVSNKRGNKAVLFTTRGYSVTTSGHKQMVRGACRHLTAFTVPNLFPSDSTHQENIKHYRESIAELSQRVLRARSNKEWLWTELKALLRQANEYSRFFGLRVKFAAPETVDRAALEAIVIGHHQLKAREERKESKLREQRRLEQEKEFHRKLDAWKAGKDVYVRTDGNAFLRVKGETIQTSAGAEVPLVHALKILPRIRSGKPYVRNGHTIHVGHFSLDEIDEKGNVKVGCHTITRGEIERIAKKLGV